MTKQTALTEVAKTNRRSQTEWARVIAAQWVRGCFRNKTPRTGALC